MAIAAVACYSKYYAQFTKVIMTLSNSYIYSSLVYIKTGADDGITV
jgi:hypothetical protein